MGAVRKGSGSERCARGQGRHSGTLGGPTIFRPMYSQPGLTDSRKAFLWAPSENRVWPQGEETPHPLPDAGPCVGRMHLGGGGRVWVPLCLCFSLGLTVCLGPFLPKHLGFSLSVWLCAPVSVSACASVSPCDRTWLSRAPRAEGIPWVWSL